VISTNTINLQEQLLNKDIPIAKQVIPEEFRYILVKGRGNYLCNRKFYNIASGDFIDVSHYSITQKEQFKEIMKWGSNTSKGDKSELPFEVDSVVWEHFQSESDMCAGGKCPYKNECFFLKSREDKKKANILITNHHLYFADLALRKKIGFDNEFSILPEYGAVVFDEAHNVEKVARSYFSHEISLYAFARILNQISPVTSKKKIENGSVWMLLQYLQKREIGEKDRIIKFLEKGILGIHKDFYESGKRYFAKLIEAFSKGEVGSIAIRLKKETLTNAVYYNDLKNLQEEFLNQYSSYMAKVRPVLKMLEEYDDKEGIVTDFIKLFGRVDNFFDEFKFITKMDEEEFIYWVEIGAKQLNAKLIATPLKIEEDLQEVLYDNVEEIIFTSATIALGESFEYFKESLGIEGKTLDKVIHSPFDYKKQMKVYIPTDIPEPTSSSFTSGIMTFLKEMILKTKGKTFVLFTSYSALNFVYYSLRDELEKKGMEFFIQGMAPRTQLVEGYKRGKNPVLFGTDSFWEGVDVKGDQLSSVIIVKLPFKVPSDPITEAIIESFTNRGKNAFMEYQIPESIIKFKQGVGRLIRSKEDKGMITVLDTRIINKKYGKYFMDAIPSPNVKVMKTSEILKELS
jgi:ATP-dependent DNA helicase DinG